MRLLLVFPFFPYPPNDGGRIGFFNPIKYLSRQNDLFVVCLAGRTEELAIEELSRYCRDVRVYRRPVGKGYLRLAKGLISFPPGASAKYWYPAAGELIREAIAIHKPDLVEFHHLNTAKYRSYAGDLPCVLREHNVESQVWERFAENSTGWIEKNYARWTAGRVKQYEGDIAACFDRCIVVSDADAGQLGDISPTAQIEVIPSGVDTEYFYPRPEAVEDPHLITLTGSFEWKPKRQSLIKLLREVFPLIRERIPEVKLQVVGKGVPGDVRRIAEGIPGVTIAGPVPDVRPYIAQSALLINYLESGGGIALKVLEAMAMRKAVLCNALGCEGIPVTYGEDICVADGVERFATAAANLIQDERARKTLADNGYRRVRERYSWDVLARAFQRCYEELILGTGRRPPISGDEGREYSPGLPVAIRNGE
jgi:glycosyltransferase involved in cell wall biosynthesis